MKKFKTLEGKEIELYGEVKEQGILRKRQENPTYKYRTNILDRLEAKDE